MNCGDHRCRLGERDNALFRITSSWKWSVRRNLDIYKEH